MIWRSLAFALLTNFLFAYSIAANAEQTEYLTIEQRNADFAQFCKFVGEEYAYFDLKKTRWSEVCAHDQLQLVNTRDRAAFIKILERSLGELYDSHAHLGTNASTSSRLVPSGLDVAAVWRDSSASANGGAPKAMITDVRRGSAAERAGLSAGAEIISIDGTAIIKAVNRFEPRYLSEPDAAAREYALQVALAGQHDRDLIRLQVRVDNQLREITFAPSTPKPAALLSHTLVGDVGYLEIHNSLGEPNLVRDFDAALLDLQGARALVIDLRDTPSGGTSVVARGILSRFVHNVVPYQRHELVGEFVDSGIRRLWIEEVAPRMPIAARPVVILVGPWTGSMGEGIAIGFDAAIGAPVLGRSMAHLLGALGETVLPNSKITVRIPTEKLFHVNGMPREKFVPCAVVAEDVSPDKLDREASSAIVLATTLAKKLAVQQPPPRLKTTSCASLQALVQKRSLD
jgi:C-terminal processing protease CtpA/Prc